VKVTEEIQRVREKEERGGKICLMAFQISSIHRCFLIPLAYIFHSP